MPTGRSRASSARSGSAWVAYHGIALNVDVALADFDLIDPCGMPGLVSASIAAELGRADEQPSQEAVAQAAAVFARALAAALGDAPLHGVLPPHADPAAERAALERLLAAQAA